MVKGLKRFQEWFRGDETSFVIIGGTACDLLMSDAGEPFRATKDIDMVLIVEELRPEFAKKFWDFIKAGDYRHQNKSTGKPEFFRFSKPNAPDFPAMIELFSRRLEGLAIPPDERLTPLPFEEEVSSLSAILLDENYYGFLKSGIAILEGVPILDAAHLIPFKAKAWLDLTARKTKGEHVDSKNIKKHIRDIDGLLSLLSPEFKLDLPQDIKEDMRVFLEVKNADGESLLSSRLASLYSIELEKATNH
jgi:hypothetical protein